MKATIRFTGYRATTPFTGGGGHDFIDTGEGADLVYGGNGNDTILGGYGSIDTIYGGDGDDVIHAMEVVTAGTSVVYGGAGRDTIIVSALGPATIDGGEGIDRIHLGWLEPVLGAIHVDFSGPTPIAVASNGLTINPVSVESVSLLSGDGNDTVIGSAYDDQLTVMRGDNYVDAGGGDDLVNYVLGGQNTLMGGSGTDTLIVLTDAAPMYFIVDGLGQVDDGQLSEISGFEIYMAYGGGGNDIAALGANNDYFFGSSGEDTVSGRSGDDTLEGGDGRDHLMGDGGQDLLQGDITLTAADITIL